MGIIGFRSNYSLFDYKKISKSCRSKKEGEGGRLFGSNIEKSLKNLRENSYEDKNKKAGL